MADRVISQSCANTEISWNLSIILLRPHVLGSIAPNLKYGQNLPVIRERVQAKNIIHYQRVRLGVLPSSHRSSLVLECSARYIPDPIERIVSAKLRGIKYEAEGNLTLASSA